MTIHPLKYVVGIGASAGGLEAIQDFFAHMPKCDDITFIVVQHLSPNFKSLMGDLLAHKTSTPIITIKNDMSLSAGVIYLVPPSFEARIENDCFKLRKLNRKVVSTPINTLFESMAEVYGQFSLGIIFSGTGSDGTLGIEQIANHGGVTFAQAPEEAAFSDMPQNAIATNEINYVLSASEMPNLILEFITQPLSFDTSIKQIKHIDQSEYDEIFHLLETKYHIDFKSYKFVTVLRRIQRRMQLLDIKSLKYYVQYLKKIMMV